MDKLVRDTNLDGKWDGDGTLSLTDAIVTKRYIVSAVQYLLKGLPVQVKRTTDGWGELQRSKAVPSRNTYVLFVGSDWQDNQGRFNATGRAYQAPQGENNEWFAYAYAGNIARQMLNKQLVHNSSGQDFLWNVAATVVHEFGHLAGLGHPGRKVSGTFVPVNQRSKATVPDVFWSFMSSGGKQRGSTFGNDVGNSYVETYRRLRTAPFLKFTFWAESAVGVGPIVARSSAAPCKASMKIGMPPATLLCWAMAAMQILMKVRDSFESLSFVTPLFSVPGATKGQKGTTT